MDTFEVILNVIVSIIALIAYIYIGAKFSEIFVEIISDEEFYPKIEDSGKLRFAKILAIILWPLFVIEIIIWALIMHIKKD